MATLLGFEVSQVRAALAEDSTGQLRATWTQQSQVFVNRTTVLGDAACGVPYWSPLTK